METKITRVLKFFYGDDALHRDVSLCLQYTLTPLYVQYSCITILKPYLFYRLQGLANTSIICDAKLIMDHLHEG